MIDDLVPRLGERLSEPAHVLPDRVWTALAANGCATMIWHTVRRPDEDQRSRIPRSEWVVSKDAIAQRLAQLLTRSKEMWRAVLLETKP